MLVISRNKFFWKDLYIQLSLHPNNEIKTLESHKITTHTEPFCFVLFFLESTKKQSHLCVW